mgnify:FL=1
MQRLKVFGENLPLGLYTYGVENCSWPKLCIVNTSRITVVRPRSNTHQYKHLDSWLRSCQSIITNDQIKNPITTWSFSAYGSCKNVSSTHLETNSFVQSHPVPIHFFFSYACQSIYNRCIYLRKETTRSACSRYATCICRSELLSFILVPLRDLRRRYNVASLRRLGDIDSMQQDTADKTSRRWDIAYNWAVHVSNHRVGKYCTRLKGRAYLFDSHKQVVHFLYARGCAFCPCTILQNDSSVFK